MSGENLTLTTPPAVEPVTLAEMLAQLRLSGDPSDPAVAADQSLLTEHIKSAREVCESRSKRSFITTTWTLAVDNFPAGGGGYWNRAIREAGPGVGWLPTSNWPLILPRADLIGVDSIVYLDPNGNPTTLDPSLYEVEPGNPGKVAPAYGHQWPTALNQIGAIKIQYRSGYGPTAASVPASIKSCIRILAAMYYENRETVGEFPKGLDALLDANDTGGYA